jgi:hypothetical protein
MSAGGRAENIKAPPTILRTAARISKYAPMLSPHVTVVRPTAGNSWLSVPAKGELATEFTVSTICGGISCPGNSPVAHGKKAGN